VGSREPLGVGEAADSDNLSNGEGYTDNAFRDDDVDVRDVHDDGCGGGCRRGVGVQARLMGWAVATALLGEAHDELEGLRLRLRLGAGVLPAARDAGARDSHDVRGDARDARGDARDVRCGVADARGRARRDDFGDAHDGVPRGVVGDPLGVLEAEVEARPGLGEYRAGTNHRSAVFVQFPPCAPDDLFQYGPIDSEVNRNHVSPREYRKAKGIDEREFLISEHYHMTVLYPLLSSPLALSLSMTPMLAPFPSLPLSFFEACVCVTPEIKECELRPSNPMHCLIQYESPGTRCMQPSELSR